MTYILALQLDPASQAHFNRLRELHFPPAINYIDAHVTLFHILPEQPSIIAEITAEANAHESFPITVTGLRSLGRGVAYVLESPQLGCLHRKLAAAFLEHLTPQDNQKFQPHIVIQNKVTPQTARNLLHQLQPAFVPAQIWATGLCLWHYRNGPWELASVFPFSSNRDMGAS